MTNNQNQPALFELAQLHQLCVKGADILEVQNPNENIVVMRPWIDEPSGSVPFDTQNGLALPVAPGDTPVLTLIVPNGYDGVIKAISNQVNFGGFTQFSGDIIWRIIANGKPIRNFESIKNTKGTIEQPRVISPIRVYSGQIIQYIVNHVANGALAGQTICSFTGYFYPSKGIS